MALYKDVSSLEVVGYTEPNNGTFSDGVDFILEKLDAIPEADVEPVRHGHWIKVMEHLCTPDSLPVETGHFHYECSECKHCEEVMEPYCNCGAKMDGKENEK